jgi:outer membrane protein assembly factor BamD (BamD/ComL family)
MARNEKTSIEKFTDTLNEEEKTLLSSYLKSKTYESLSEKFEEILKELHENKKINNKRI